MYVHLLKHLISTQYMYACVCSIPTSQISLNILLPCHFVEVVDVCM